MATSSTKLEEVGLADRVAPALRPIRSARLTILAACYLPSVCHHFVLLDRSDCSPGRPGSTLLLKRHQRRLRSWDALRPARPRSTFWPTGRVYANRLRLIARLAGLAAGPTPCCRPASSPSRACCRPDEAMPNPRRRSPRPTAAVARVVAKNPRPPSTPRSNGGTGSRCPPGDVRPARGTGRRLVPASAPRSSSRHRDDDVCPRRRLPVRMRPVDAPTSGTTAYEKRTSSELVAEWDPDLFIQCGNCSFRLPAQRIRAPYSTVPAEGGLGFQVASVDPRGSSPTPASTLQV